MKTNYSREKVYTPIKPETDDGMYSIWVNTKLCKKEVIIKNFTDDEAISTGIVLFDKYSTRVGDCVTINYFLPVSQKGALYDYTVKTIRKITLMEGLKVNVEVY